MNNTKWIYFDMDGTLNRFYEVENWLPMLRAEDPTPYKVAVPMHNMNQLARTLNRLQKMGFQIGIISWLSKCPSPAYDQKVTAAKLFWLNKHLHSVKWDAIHIVPYGRTKWEVCGAGILFDDEEQNRNAWQGESYTPENIMKVLRELLIRG